MNFDEAQLEIAALSAEIENPLRWYHVEERREREAAEIKAGVLMCLAKLGIDFEQSAQNGTKREMPI